VIKFGETWAELSETGQRVISRRMDFDSIPEQIAFLRQMVSVYAGTSWAKETALQIIREANCPARNHACYALAIAEAVQKRIRYIREYPETFQTPPRTWRIRAGDCDDFTTTTNTLWETLGIRNEIVGMKIAGKWRHVFSRALIESPRGLLRVPLDGTLRNTPVRQMANPITRSLARGLTVETFVV
jgi:hypothetical protein